MITEESIWQELPELYYCSGCALVAGILRDRNLTRYYDLRGSRGVPVASPEASRGPGEWLSLIEADLQNRPGLFPIQLDAQGLHCSGCVWLVEEMFRRQNAEGRVITNPIRGTIDLLVKGDFPLRAFVTQVQRRHPHDW